MNVLIIGNRKPHVGGDLGYPELERLGHKYVFLYEGQKYPFKNGVLIDSKNMGVQIRSIVVKYKIDLLFFRADWFDPVFINYAREVFSMEISVPKIWGYHCHCCTSDSLEAFVYSKADGFVFLNNEAKIYFSENFGESQKPCFLLPSLWLPPLSWYACKKKKKLSTVDGQKHLVIPSATIRLSRDLFERQPSGYYTDDRYDYFCLIQELAKRQIHVHIFGTFFEWSESSSCSVYSQYTAKIYNKLACDSRYIHFEGRTDIDEFSPAISCFDGAIMCGFLPGQKVPPFEHMNYQLRFNSSLAAELPVFVAAKTSSALEREVVLSGAGCVFDSFDFLKQKINDEQFMKNAVESVIVSQKRHSFEEWLPKLISFFDSIVKKQEGFFECEDVNEIRSIQRTNKNQLNTKTTKKTVGDFKDLFSGKRAFIIGNGPSLNLLDLSKLKNEITFGVNSIFYNFTKMGFKPTFYVVEDTLVAEDRCNEINNLSGMTNFFGKYLDYCLDDKDDVIWLNVNFDYSNYIGFPHFSKDAADCLWVGGTVTYLCMQLAYYMGFSEVYLVGFDHSYKIPDNAIVEGSVITSTSDDINHFHSDYFGKGKRWHDPRLDRMELAYRRAKSFFENSGKIIYNATKGGHLEIFPRIKFSSIFDEKNKLCLSGKTDRVTQENLEKKIIISVIVCTHRNPVLLRKTLASLDRQNLDDSLFEIIVVDNNSKDLTRQIIDGFPRMHYLYEEKLGLSFARNAGIEASKGDIVAFIDDDAEASPEWLESLLEIYEKVPKAWSVGGKVLPIWDAEKPEWLTEKFYRSLSLVEWGEEARELHWPERIIGTNCSFRKKVFAGVGLFDTDLGRVGPLMLGNEDTEIQQRILSSGHLVYYTPLAVVYHHVPASRMTPEYFKNRLQGTRVSEAIMELRAQGKEADIQKISANLRKNLDPQLNTNKDDIKLMEVLSLNRQGVNLLNQGNYEGALFVFQKAIELDPGFHAVHYNMGLLRYKCGDKEKALIHFRLAVQLQSDNIEYKKTLADFYYVAMRQVGEAIGIYTKVLDQNQDDGDVLLMLAKIYFNLQKWDESGHFCRRLLAVDPHNQECVSILKKLSDK